MIRLLRAIALRSTGNSKKRPVLCLWHFALNGSPLSQNIKTRKTVFFEYFLQFKRTQLRHTETRCIVIYLYISLIFSDSVFFCVKLRRQQRTILTYLAYVINYYYLTDHLTPLGYHKTSCGEIRTLLVNVILWGENK